MKLFSAAVLATAVSAKVSHHDARTCVSYKSTDGDPNPVFYGKYGKKVDTCILSRLMENGNLGRDHMRKAMDYIAMDKNNAEKLKQKYAEGAWQRIIEDWKVLIGQESVPDTDTEIINCGFKENVKVRDGAGEGYMKQCGVMCAGMKNYNDAEGAKNAIKTILNAFLTIINDQFGVRYPKGNCMFDETKELRGEKNILLHDGYVNGYNDDCTIEDKCHQLIININKDIAEFEDLLGGKGSIPNLDRHFELQIEQLTKLDENNEFYDDLHRTGIYGIGKEAVKGLRNKADFNSKYQHRYRDWMKRFPSDFIINGGKINHPDEYNKWWRNQKG